jgi:hypothetical protein
MNLVDSSKLKFEIWFLLDFTDTKLSYLGEHNGFCIGSYGKRIIISIFYKNNLIWDIDEKKTGR